MSKPSPPSGRPDRANVISLSELRVNALRLECEAALRTITMELHALEAGYQIDDETSRELRVIIEEIGADIGCADGQANFRKNAD